MYKSVKDKLLGMDDVDIQVYNSIGQAPAITSVDIKYICGNTGLEYEDVLKSVSKLIRNKLIDDNYGEYEIYSV